jgi:hypothetical protein
MTFVFLPFSFFLSRSSFPFPSLLFSTSKHSPLLAQFYWAAAQRVAANYYSRYVEAGVDEEEKQLNCFLLYHLQAK